MPSHRQDTTPPQNLVTALREANADSRDFIADLIAEFADHGRLSFEAVSWDTDHKPSAYTVCFDGVHFGTPESAATAVKSFPTIGAALCFLDERRTQAQSEEAGALKRRFLVFDCELADGVNRLALDPDDLHCIQESLKNWLAEASPGDEVTIRFQEMTQEEFDELGEI